MGRTAVIRANLLILSGEKREFVLICPAGQILQAFFYSFINQT
jgi:hypothetical protein